VESEVSLMTPSRLRRLSPFLGGEFVPLERGTAAKRQGVNAKNYCKVRLKAEPSCLKNRKFPDDDWPAVPLNKMN